VKDAFLDRALQQLINFGREKAEHANVPNGGVVPGVPE